MRFVQSAALSLGLLVGCAARVSTPVSAAMVEPPPTEAPRPPEAGVASFYADALIGRRTANGERYDARALTAAHRSLPFGTIVDVVRTNGQRVRVRINDRGPFVRGRIIDLSRAAARAIQLERAGIARVMVVPVWVPPKKRTKR